MLDSSAEIQIEENSESESNTDFNSSLKMKQVSKNFRQKAHKEPPAEEISLKDIMKEIMPIKARQDFLEKYQAPKSKSDKQNWRQSTPLRTSTQEFHKMLDSQQRNATQSSQEK